MRCGLERRIEPEFISTTIKVLRISRVTSAPDCITARRFREYDIRRNSSVDRTPRSKIPDKDITIAIP
ncbi:uncharacterized protein FOMMEDRAFT_151782 [Fomitiporia mediterranea MF3/22]|uniref:uncharacterized protein n=1 Tax=Fomitiporia mediterranea (strain MF3/22) TaxID=694068 RepID=UPI0004407DFF|nr:uncharacterized protein FOMMEDRAFT_151782 [Fomitiporia mediterranea MF3/22]EJD06512.1 hypothetical protein FOMMEDRAFT_151782 [Fomitiporia mediterranea MF3/22]